MRFTLLTLSMLIASSQAWANECTVKNMNRGEYFKVLVNGGEMARINSAGRDQFSIMNELTATIGQMQAVGVCTGNVVWENINQGVSTGG